MTQTTREYVRSMYSDRLEAHLVAWVRGDFARGQRDNPIADENAIIPLGSFGDVER